MSSTCSSQEFTRAPSQASETAHLQTQHLLHEGPATGPVPPVCLAFEDSEACLEPFSSIEPFSARKVEFAEEPEREERHERNFDAPAAVARPAGNAGAPFGASLELPFLLRLQANFTPRSLAYSPSNTPTPSNLSGTCSSSALGMITASLQSSLQGSIFTPLATPTPTNIACGSPSYLHPWQSPIRPSSPMGPISPAGSGIIGKRAQASDPAFEQAVEWVRQYSEEFGRFPGNPEQLLAFVANRGGQLTYRLARKAITS